MSSNDTIQQIADRVEPNTDNPNLTVSVDPQSGEQSVVMEQDGAYISVDQETLTDLSDNT